MNDEGFVVFVSVVAFIIVAFSFVRSFVRCDCSFARARFREREREREFKSENLSETSSISREWGISRGNKTEFFKNEVFLSQPFVVSSKLSKPPKALARGVAENVARSSSLDRSRTIRDDNTPPPKKKRKDFEFK